MSMYTLLRNNPSPTQEEMEHAFEGNLCRCTGYRPILDGFRTFCSDCTCKGGEEENDDQKLFDASKFIPLDPSQEVIFPPKLKVSRYSVTSYSIVLFLRLKIKLQFLLKSKDQECLGTGRYH